jgi:hypothetical protein
MMTLGKLQRINSDSDGGTVRCKWSPFAMFPLMPSLMTGGTLFHR